jgi:hypothetical protein
MKEASMHDNDLSVPDKNNIWLSRKILLMESISISQPMNDGADDHFWARITISDTRHVEATLFCRVNVGHSCRR